MDLSMDVDLNAPARPNGPAAPHRILHVFRAPLGGLFRHVLDLARAQAAAGHQVGIFCDSSTGGERAAATLRDLEPHLALGLHRVPIRRNPHPTDMLRIARLAKVAGEVRPTVLHGHGSKGGAYARLVGGPVTRDAVRAYTPHGGSFNYKPGSPLHRVYMGIEGLLARRTDLFLFESEYIAGRFRSFVGATDRLIRIVPNGVGEAEFEPLERVPDAFDLLYVGELREAKGVDVLIDALAILRRRGRRYTLLTVGSGPSAEALQQRARTQGVWDSIAFVPPQPIRPALGRARIMVIPSLAESLPYVILEAAAAAQPLVSTNVGGIPEIFGPFADGLVAPGDPGALADAIALKVDEDDTERQARAQALSGHVRSRFSLAQMIEGVVGGYNAALALKSAA